MPAYNCEKYVGEEGGSIRVHVDPQQPLLGYGRRAHEDRSVDKPMAGWIHVLRLAGDNTLSSWFWETRLMT